MDVPESTIDIEEESTYYREAASWDFDREAHLTNSRRVAVWIAAASAMIAILEAVAIVSLTPLKSVEGYVVRVDASTGIVDELVRIRDHKEDYDEVVTKYFLRRVVLLREGYTRAELQTNYDQSLLFTAPDARPALKASFAFEGATSPYRRYGEHGSATLRIVHIAFLATHVAQVRYVRTDTLGGADPVSSHWIATINYRYVSTPASEEARGVNPLGFQVTGYRNDPESGDGDSR